MADLVALQAAMDANSDYDSPPSVTKAYAYRVALRQMITNTAQISEVSDNGSAQKISPQMLSAEMQAVTDWLKLNDSRTVAASRTIQMVNDGFERCLVNQKL